jgi:prepilin peptidase CpaA
MFLLLISSLYVLIAVNDILYRKIPDTFPVLISSIGLGMLVINGDWLEGFTTFGLAVVTFLVLALLCIAGKLGGGDVKLLAASVLLVGSGSFLDFLLLTALAGGVLSLIYIAAFLTLKLLPTKLLPTSSAAPPPPPISSRKARSNRLNLLWRIERRRILRRSSIPYGVAISGGSILSLALLSI